MMRAPQVGVAGSGVVGPVAWVVFVSGVIKDQMGDECSRQVCVLVLLLLMMMMMLVLLVAAAAAMWRMVSMRAHTITSSSRNRDAD